MGFATRILITGAILMLADVVVCSFPATLTLKRAFPNSHRVELSQLSAWDRQRCQTGRVGLA
ncbi:unnamed protein product [Prunus armeniaca]